MPTDCGTNRSKIHIARRGMLQCCVVDVYVDDVMCGSAFEAAARHVDVEVTEPTTVSTAWRLLSCSTATSAPPPPTTAPSV